MCVWEMRTERSSVSCPSLISAFPLSLFPPQTGFNYCPCSDLKLLWPLRMAPSPVLIAAQTSPPLQTSAILLCRVPLSFLLLSYWITLSFFQYYSLHSLLILPCSCISSPNTSKLSPVYKCPRVVLFCSLISSAVQWLCEDCAKNKCAEKILLH